MNQPPPHHLADLTSAAFANQLGDAPIILLPLGSQEDHGPYLPMGDHHLATLLAGRIADTCNAAGTAVLVAPTLPFGVADYFGASPGGMAISAATFKALLTELLAGLLAHGAPRIVILNGHGGNAPVIHEVTLALKHQGHAIIPCLYLWKIARVLMERAAPSAAYGHGAEPLLSLTAALRPETIQHATPTPTAPQMLGLPVSGFGSLDFNGIPIDVPAEFDQVPNTVIRTAKPSIALGETIAARLVQETTNFMIHFEKITKNK